MGYTTQFSGTFKIEPPLSPAQVTEVNEFCEERHERPTSNYPSIWCDYEVSPDGTQIGWNGSEKSYEMAEWLLYLIERFFRPWKRKLDGKMRARGEDFDDVWTLFCEANVVTRKDGW